MVTTRQQRAAQEGRPAGGSSPAPTPSKRRGSTGGGKASSKGSGWASGRTQVFLYYPNLVGTSHPNPWAATAGGEEEEEEEDAEEEEDEWASEAAKGVEGRMSDVPPLPRTMGDRCVPAGYLRVLFTLASFVFGVRGEWSWCVSSYFLGFFGDLVDGYLARRFNQSEAARRTDRGRGRRGEREGGSDACGCLSRCGWVVPDAGSEFGAVLDMVTDR